jgi:translation initiation factor RLI1
MDDAKHVLFPRFSAELVSTALRDTPVVMVTGPRQCGKTTLVRDLVAGNREFTSSPEKWGKRAVIGIVHAGWKLRLIRIKVASISDYRFV